MMDQLIKRFPEQLREALEIGRNADINKPSNAIYQIFVAGMGGSGIGADFVAEFVYDSCPVPYLSGKGYDIPNYIDEHTIALVSSYSGNTEETLSAYRKLIQTGAKIIAVTSGGQLLDLAHENDLDYVKVPGDWPSPRACLGYSLVAQLCILQKLGYAEEKLLDQVSSAADLLEKNRDEIKEKAERIAHYLQGKIPVIYTTDRMESVAVRFRQQVNENAKMLAWHHVIPEMNHNELVGWRDDHEDLAVLYFRNRDDFGRNQTRIDINKEIISNYTSSIIEVYSKGNNLIERALYHVHLGDWISWYLAGLHGVDAVEVKVIDYLKGELAKVKE